MPACGKPSAPAKSWSKLLPGLSYRKQMAPAPPCGQTTASAVW